MEKCIALVEGFNKFLGILAGLSIAVGALLIIVEVLSRSSFGFSLQLADEYSGYLMAGSSFLGLAYVESEHGHIRMDLMELLKYKYPSFLRFLRIVTYLLAAAFSAYLACVGWLLFWQSYQYGSVSMQISETPLAIPQFFIPFGALALFLQYLCNLYKYCRGQSKV